LKVLFSQKISGISGSERYFINIIPELQKRGVEIEFLVLYTELSLTIDFVEIMNSFGVKTKLIPIHGFYLFSSITKILSFLKLSKFDIIHSHLIHSDVIMAFISFLGFKPKLLSTKHGYDEVFIKKHSLLPNKKLFNLYFFAAWFAERFIDQSFTVSHGLSQLYFNLGITNYYPKVIWHGFKLDRDYLITSEEEKEAPYILVLGRLEIFKGHKMLFDAFKLLSDEYPDVHIKVVGDGSAKDEFIRYAAEIGLEKRVEFTGFISNVNEQIAKSLFLASPSKGEGFGLIILEAFAHKKPVISFDVPAFNEIIEHGKNGFLADAFEVGSFSKYMAILLSDSTKRVELGNYGKLFLEEKFSLEICIDQTFACYQNIVEKAVRKKPLGILTLSLYGGGAEKVAFQSALELSDFYDVHVFVLTKKIQFQIPNSVSVWCLSRFNFSSKILKSLYLFPQSMSLYRLSKRLKTKTVLSLLNRPNYLNIINGVLIPGQKAIISERTYTNVEFPKLGISNRTSRFLVTVLYPLADKILVNSKKNLESLNEDFLIEKDKMDLFYNPFNMPNKPIDKQVKRSEILKILSVGRLDENKNVILLLKVLAKVDFSFELKILGSGPLEKKLKAFVLANNLEDRVFFKGFVVDPTPYFRNSDVFVLCSKHEGYPNVLLESVFSGLEVVSSDCFSGPREMIDPNEQIENQLHKGWEKHDLGYLYAFDDSDALLEILNQVESERRKVKSTDQILKLQNRHDVKNVVKNLRLIID
tara:strand:+ start:6164 stop:8425 length:2262 start_codon:yes stop_codon:yes gene_type:complete